MIKNWNQFNEGIVNKAKELMNFSTIRENDKIAKKYIDEIKIDFEKNYKETGKKALLKFHIIRSDSDYWTLSYKMTKDILHHSGVANSNSGDKEFKITWIKNTLKWSSDSSGGRMEGSIFEPYVGSRELFGRERGTEKLITNDKGIDKNTSLHAYINISESIAKSVIDFFIKKFETIYPELKKSKYLYSGSIFEVDNDLRDELIGISKKRMEEGRKKSEDKTNAVKQLFSKHSTDVYNEIEDYLMSLTDVWEHTNVFILNVIKSNGTIYWHKAGRSYFIHESTNVDYPEVKENVLYYCLCLQAHEPIEEYEGDGGVIYKDASESQKSIVNEEILNIHKKLSDNYLVDYDSDFAKFLLDKMSEDIDHTLGYISCLITENN